MLVTRGDQFLNEVKPSAHPSGPYNVDFFATEHTMSRYKTAFYEPLVADATNFGTWTEAGALTATDRARGMWQQAL